MALTTSQRSALNVLTELLQSQDYKIMLDLPFQSLTPALRARLRDLSDNFQKRKRKRDDADEDDGLSGGEPAPKKKKSGGPMSRLCKIKALVLDEVFITHLRHHGTEPLLFLEGEVALQFAAQGPEGRSTKYEAFAACYWFAMDIEERATMDRVRWCFTMIMFFEFMKLLHPGATGARVGSRMHEDAVEFLQIVFDQDPGQLRPAKANIDKWCTMGKKLAWLCEEFGEGAIFFLYQHLSDDFVRQKLFVKGEYASEVVEHLHLLRLKEKGEETRTTELGKKLRKLMVAPLRAKLRSADQDGGDG